MPKDNRCLSALNFIDFFRELILLQMENDIRYYYDLWMTMALLGLFTMLLPILAGIKYRKVFNKPTRIFFIYVIVHFIVASGEQAVYWMMVYQNPILSMILKFLSLKTFNFYSIFFIISDFLLLGYFFYLLLVPRKIAKWVFIISYSILASTIINFLFIEGPDGFGTYNITVQAFFNFILPIIYMWILYHTDSKVSLYKNPYFWINLGLIIPNLLGLFLFFAGDKIKSTDFLLFCQIMIIRSIIEIISQILITIGFAYGRYAQFLR